jgi:hypothetical protein
VSTARGAADRRLAGQSLCFLCVLASLGCATANYQYGHFANTNSGEVVPASITIERGEPDKTLDTMAYVVETPERVLPFLPQTKRHELSPETTEKLTTYLQSNDLADVKIQVNQYAPAEQWRMLRENHRISAGWRYTVGVCSVVGYTLFPGRVFGINDYNIYTNCLNLNSDRPAVLLREAAVAKDIHAQRWPGTYAAFTALPGLALIRRTRSVNEVVSYAQFIKDWEIEKQAYRVLYPSLGMETTMMGMPAVTTFAAWWCAPLVPLGGAAFGGLTGYTVSSMREAEIHGSVPATPPQPAAELQQVGHAAEPDEMSFSKGDK